MFSQAVTHKESGPSVTHTRSLAHRYTHFARRLTKLKSTRSGLQLTVRAIVTARVRTTVLTLGRSFFVEECGLPVLEEAGPS